MIHKVKPASPLVSCDLETQAQNSGGCGIIQDYAYTLLKNIQIESVKKSVKKDPPMILFIFYH